MADTVFFYLSKIGWTLIRPDSWIVLGLINGLWALFGNRHRLAKRVLTATMVFSLAIATLPVGAWLLAPVEAAFPARAAPDRVDGIIILGGFEDFLAQDISGQAATNGAAEQVLEGLALARAYPEATVVLSGGSGDPRRQGYSGAAIAMAHATALGFAPERFVVEATSRNTFENARNTLELVNIGPDETWLLVTSANHMPRSLGIFCAQGVRLSPYPVDFRSGATERWPTWNLVGNLSDLTLATRMWLGLGVYWATGRSSELVPKLCQAT